MVMNNKRILRSFLLILIISSLSFACKKKVETTENQLNEQEKIDSVVINTMKTLETQIGKPVPNLSIYD